MKDLRNTKKPGKHWQAAPSISVSLFRLRHFSVYIKEEIQMFESSGQMPWLQN